jgi:hypothetical protein
MMAQGAQSVEKKEACIVSSKSGSRRSFVAPFKNQVPEIIVIWCHLLVGHLD